jgi:hypothetical protein
MGIWVRDGQPILDLIQEIGDTTKEIAEAIRDELESCHSTREDYEMGNETEFSSESCYESSAVASGELEAKWTKFEHSLKTESRYFSHTAMQVLDTIFSDLEGHRTYRGESVIVDAGPNAPLKNLFRARFFQSKASLLTALERPEISIGPPPPLIAGAGRMNARGIPVFYGATHPEVALAEVRPPVGSKVVVAQFDIIRPLRLLNVESLQMLSVGGSHFDPMYLLHIQKAAFLRELSERIAIPVVPEDESREYIATQVIAEYLASLEKPALDGMIFPSAQVASKEMKNVVLFHKSAVVANVKRPEGVEFRVRDCEDYEGGPEIEYSVVEEFDSEAVSPSPKDPTLEELMAEMKMNALVDYREPALELSVENVWVRDIKCVEIHSDSYQVSRRLLDKKTYREVEEHQIWPRKFTVDPTESIEI